MSLVQIIKYFTYFSLSCNYNAILSTDCFNMVEQGMCCYRVEEEPFYIMPGMIISVFIIYRNNVCIFVWLLELIFYAKYLFRIKRIILVMHCKA